jgi:hypothetical protein
VIQRWHAQLLLPFAFAIPQLEGRTFSTAFSQLSKIKVAVALQLPIRISKVAVLLAVRNFLKKAFKEMLMEVRTKKVADLQT